MSIDDIRVPSALGVDVWRSVLHDVIDEVLDQILLTVEYEVEDERFDDEDEPPGDPPDPARIPDPCAVWRDGGEPDAEPCRPPGDGS